jgi:O-antigen/teichoic acid export membrane protein
MKSFLATLQHRDHRTKRSSLLRLAILSSGVSKLCGLLLQAIAIPLLYHSLGPHRYALYLLLTGALGTITLLQLGAGPGLTQGIAKANAAAATERAASLLGAALHLAAAAAALGGVLFLALVYIVPPEKLFGAAFAANRNEIWRDADACVALFALQIVSGVVDSALAGYQEQVLIHLGSMTANLASIGLLFLVCQGQPTLIAVMLVLYGVPALPRIVNLALLFQRRPHLLRGLITSRRDSYSLLLNVGAAFWAFEIGGLLEQNAGNYILAHLSSTQATALFATVYKSVVLAGSVVATVTMPLWPAFTDAVAHRDIEWIRRSYSNIRRALTVYSCAVALVMSVAGRWAFSAVLHVDTTGADLLFVAFGAYFCAHIWTHLYYVTLMGMDAVWRVALILLAESLLMLLFGILMVPRLGATGMALAYLSASLLLPAWLLPRLMHQAIHRLASRASEGGDGLLHPPPPSR